MAVVKLPNEKVYTYWLPQWIKRLQKHRSQPPPRTALAAIVLSTCVRRRSRFFLRRAGAHASRRAGSGASCC